MATFKQYTKKDGSKAWKFQTYLGTDPVTGKEIRTTRRNFKTKKEASNAEKKLQADFLKNGRNQTQIKTFMQLYDLWLPQYRLKVKPSTVAATVDIFNRYILPHFGALMLEKISVSYCQKILNGWHQHYKAFNGFKVKLNLLFDFAVSIEAMQSNPMAKTQTPRKKESDKKLNFYTKEQLEQFFDILKTDNDPLKLTYWRVLAFTGMRKSEALALQWKDLNPLKGEITIGKTVAMDENGKVVLQTPKTNNSYRTISIDPITISILNNWRSTQKENYLFLGYNTNSADQFIFTSNTNELMRPTRVCGWLRTFFNQHPNELPKITPHGFRHTHCSLLFEAGVSMKEVQARLGHKDIQTTMNIYAHVSPEKIKDTGEKFARYVNF